MADPQLEAIRQRRMQELMARQGMGKQGVFEAFPLLEKRAVLVFEVKEETQFRFGG
jgi:hypothetical protein